MGEGVSSDSQSIIQSWYVHPYSRALLFSLGCPFALLYSCSSLPTWSLHFVCLSNDYLDEGSNGGHQLLHWDEVHSNLLQRGDEILNNKEDESDRKEFADLIEWVHSLPKNKVGIYVVRMYSCV